MPVDLLATGPRSRIHSMFTCGSRGGPTYSWGAGYRPSPGLSMGQDGSPVSEGKPCGQARSPLPSPGLDSGVSRTREAEEFNPPRSRIQRRAHRAKPVRFQRPTFPGLGRGRCPVQPRTV